MLKDKVVIYLILQCSGGDNYSSRETWVASFDRYNKYYNIGLTFTFLAKINCQVVCGVPV